MDAVVIVCATMVVIAILACAGIARCLNRQASSAPVTVSVQRGESTEMEFARMWLHDCPREGRVYVGKGEACSWCGVEEPQRTPHWLHPCNVAKRDLFITRDISCGWCGASERAA